MTKKDEPYSWSPAHQQAFERLKERLTAAPVLVYPNFTMPFLLETDASRDGLPHPSGKLAHWGLELQELDLTIQYRSGRENRNADALSRNLVEDGNRLGRDVITEQRPGYPPIFTVGADAQEKQWPNCEHGGSTSRNVNIHTIHDCNDVVSNCNNVHTCSTSRLCEQSEPGSYPPGRATAGL